MIHRIAGIAGIAGDCKERAAGRPAARPAQQSGSVGPGPPIVTGPWSKLLDGWAGLAAGGGSVDAILCNPLQSYAQDK